jgi:hypothetical protein
MEVSTHAAFDLVIIQNKVWPGDVMTFDPLVNNVGYYTEDYPYYHVATKGNMKMKNLDTNDIVVFEEGAFTHHRTIPAGKYEVINDSYYEFFCVSPYMNPSFVPVINKVEPFVLDEGEEVTVAQGKRIFMMEGAVTIAGKNYTNINRLRFTTGNKKVTALRKTYGLYIK